MGRMVNYQMKSSLLRDPIPDPYPMPAPDPEPEPGSDPDVVPPLNPEPAPAFERAMDTRREKLMRKIHILTESVFVMLLCALSAAAQTTPQPGTAAPGATAPTAAPQQPAPAATPQQPAPAAAPQQSLSTAANTSSNLSEDDKRFLAEAATGGLAEVELSQVAVQKGNSDQVKKFAQRMIDEHGKANEQLKQIAGSGAATLPQQLSPGDQAYKDRLSSMSGQAFDNYYMDLMLKNHDDAVASFFRESVVGTNSGVKTFAKNTLPTLQDHLNEVRNIVKAQNAPSSQGVTAPAQ